MAAADGVSWHQPAVRMEKIEMKDVIIQKVVASLQQRQLTQLEQGARAGKGHWSPASTTEVLRRIVEWAVE